MTKPFVQVRVTRDLSKEDIKDILCSAFEGGINYWVEQVIIPNNGLEMLKAKQVGYYHELVAEDIPLTLVTEDGNVELDLKKFVKGIRKFAKNHPQLAGDLDPADLDADCADLIVQYGAFGEHVYC